MEETAAAMQGSYVSASQAAADALACPSSWTSPGRGNRRSVSPSPVAPSTGLSSPLLPASSSSPTSSWLNFPGSPCSPILSCGDASRRAHGVDVDRRASAPAAPASSVVGIAGAQNPTLASQFNSIGLADAGSPESPFPVSALMFSPSSPRAERAGKCVADSEPQGEAQALGCANAGVDCSAAATNISSLLLSPSTEHDARDGGRCREHTMAATPVPPLETVPEGAGGSASCATPAATSDVQMWSVDDFDLGPRIGTGTFSYIQLARERETGTKAVLKVLRKRRIQRLRVQRHVTHEIEIQAHLRHPGVLRLFGYFWDASKIYMILEYAQRGDLGRELKSQPHGRFGERDAAGLMAQVVGAIAYCHSVHVIHRDLKPQNILVARGKKLKLADFGWAVHALPGEHRRTLCGTLDYLPPEMVHVTVGHSFPVDVWAMGILTYELMVGEPPFFASTREGTYRKILAATPTYPTTSTHSGACATADVPSPELSTTAQKFISCLLQRDPIDRSLAPEVSAHEWLAGNCTVDAPLVGKGATRSCYISAKDSGEAAAAGGA